jgi:hypothetical protein
MKMFQTTKQSGNQNIANGHCRFQHHAGKAYRGSEFKVSSILNINTRLS